LRHMPLALVRMMTALGLMTAAFNVLGGPIF
jgi:hypothetical protein